jgi:membrane-associated phospholipid phosphatase
VIAVLKIGAEIGQFAIPIAAGSYAIYKGDYEEAASLCLSALLQKVQIVFLKKIFPKLRPNGLDYKSFPSGHTAGAFLGVGLLLAKYGIQAMPTSFAAAGAIFVAFSRYSTSDHWAVDVCAGAAMGLFNGALAGKRFFLPKLS